MHISGTHNFVYFAPAKTGTSSLLHVLEKDYGSTQRGKSRHLVGLPEYYHSFFRFGSVRHPYTWVPSHYNHIRRDRRHWHHDGALKMSFEQFVPWFFEHADNQFRWLKQHADYLPPPGCVKFKLDAFIRMEHMSEDFNTKLPFVKKQKRFVMLTNQNPSNQFSTYKRIVVSRRIRAMIREWAAEDFKAFGYKP